MIWIVGGTSDTTKLLDLLSGKIDFSKLIVSVTTDYGEQLLKFYKVKIFKGKIEKEEIHNFIEKNQIDTIVDTSHPYAENISKNILELIDLEKINYIRYERAKSIENNEDTFESVEKLIDYINKNMKNEVILSTLGSKAIPKLAEIENNKVFLRILPTVESVKSAIDYNFLPKDIIAIQGPFSKEFEEEILKFYKASVLLTKDSGEAGGLSEKLEVCKKLGIKCLIVSRPKIDYLNVLENIEEILKYV
jgi:precorrin-6A/cobalt-precorrin-6A reductase